MTNNLEKNKKKILITGGSGFVAQNILDALKEKQYPAIIYNLGRTAIEGDNVVNIPCEAATFDFGTITEQFDHIVHTLALSNESYCKDFSYAETINIDFTRKLLSFAAKQSHLKKFIYISTIILYANSNTTPVTEDGKLYLHHSTYGFTKGIAEHYVNHYREKFGLPAVIFRLSNIYGPHQKYANSPFLVPGKIVQGLTEGKIEVFNFSPRRDWIYSLDAARAMVQALDAPATGIFNLGRGEATSVKELITEIADNLHVPFSSLNKPTSGPTDFYCDISKTKEAFLWEPTTSLHDGIKYTIDYIKDSLTQS